MTWETLIARYQQHLEILNQSPRTQATVRSYLALWRAFTGEIELADAQAVTTGTVMDFQRWLFYRPTTRNGMKIPASLQSPCWMKRETCGKTGGTS